MSFDDEIVKLKNALGENLAALYQVGISDNSKLSDIDLVVVAKNIKLAKKAIYANKLKIDVRAILTPQMMHEESIYFPYAQIKCIAGEPIVNGHNEAEESSLVKLAGMFFYAFLRNYYRLRNKKCSAQDILVNLNDFEYALIWLPETEQTLRPFIQKLRTARENPEMVSLGEARDLLEDGINFSWWLIGVLDEKLMFALPSHKRHIHRVFLRENTIFWAGSAQECREKTEANIFKHSRAKKLFLPASFERIISQPEESFTHQYAKRYLVGPKFGQSGWLKHHIKMLA